ncbi:MAG: hypothetical protein NZO58_00775 [Gemmataceae bacterium]|nr:hypothetical protein [Gemmataceae bacterium]
MVRFGSFAVVGLAVLGSLTFAPHAARADYFDIRFGIGNSYVQFGTGPRFLPAPPIVLYPLRPAPIVVEPPCGHVCPPPVVVAPTVRPTVPVYRSYPPVAVPPPYQPRAPYFWGPRF